MAVAILRDVPTALHTDRLLLRVPRVGDGAVVHAAVVETLPALRAWPASLPWAMFEPSVDASEAFCRDSHDAFVRRTSLAYLAFDASDRFVATASLHGIDWAVPRFELGYWCRSGRQRQGFVREAVDALLRLAFDTLDARRVEAFTDAANDASRAVCERAGLSLEGVMRQHRVTPSGDLRDTCVYARIG